nr:Uncharacterised protein [Klebsiella pneumoniae]
MISYQELVRTFPSYRRKTADAGDALCLRCITVLEPLRCRELPLSENLPYNSNQWSLLIGLCTGCISVLLWLIASIFRFSAVDLSLPEHTQTLFWITNMMLAVVSSWLGYLAWNLCSRRLPVSLTGQMVVLKPFSRCYMVLSIHSAFRICRKLPPFYCCWAGSGHGTLPSAQPSRLRR